MARILTPITSQAYERIRDRIGEILADELVVQAAIEYADELDAEVFVERFIPFDKEDMPCVNVLLGTGNYDNKAAVKVDGTYTYNIDCYMTCKTKTGKNGDSEASFKLQKLMGVCRAILENTQYKTLGFTPPFISHTEVRSISIANPVNNQDATSVVMGRITFIVRVPEFTTPVLPSLLAGYDTVMKLNLTNKGYFFSANATDAPVASFITVPDPPTGEAPITIEFEDTSINTPTSWLWEITGGTLDEDYEFIDGDATSQSPTIRFITLGDYEVTLTATNAFGNNTSAPTTISATAPVCAPATVENSDESYSEEVASGGTLVLPDIAIKRSDATLIANVPSVKDYTVADTVIKNSDNSFTQNIKAASSDIILPDVNNTDGDGSVIATPAQIPFVCKTLQQLADEATAAQLSSVILLVDEVDKISYHRPFAVNAASYRTGDEGWRRQNGFFNYIKQGKKPIRQGQDPDVADGSANDWLKLSPKTPNAFGGLDIWTDINGNTVLTTNGMYLINHYTGQGWVRYNSSNPTAADGTQQASNSVSWNDAIDAALASTLHGFNDWFVASWKEYMSIESGYLGTSMIFANSLISNSNVFLFSGTTLESSSTNAHVFRHTTGNVFGTTQAKTALRNYAMVRNHY